MEMSEPIENAATRCYAQAFSDCGTLLLRGDGEHHLSLEAIEIQPGDIGLAVVSVHLIPVAHF